MATRYSPAPEPLSTAFLLIERLKSNGAPVWAVKWRSADGERLRRRLGWAAWVEPDGHGGWRARSGRPHAGALTEFQARRRMPDLIRAVEEERRSRPEPEPPPRPDATFRALAHAWLEHVESVIGGKPSTLRDYRSMLAEPGAAYRRGTGRARGRIMAALGDLPAAEVTTADVERLLTAHSNEGVGTRSVNKHRQVVSAIFNFGLRPENTARWQLAGNPAVAALKRREDAPKRLEVFTVEQVEALARAAETGAWRAPGTDSVAEEDQQLGDLLRIAAYTGLRRGELITLRWRDVNWAERVLVVERALSGTVEGVPKSRRSRFVPLGDQALAAFDRLSRRPNFTGPDDYVFANIAGDRLDDSALRRRYIAAREAASLPPLRFHDLRHTAGTLLTRVLEPVTVRDVLGHADLKTTERYLHAIRASRLAEAATRAFAPEPDADQAARASLRALVEQLGAAEARRVLDAVR